MQVANIGSRLWWFFDRSPAPLSFGMAVTVFEMRQSLIRHYSNSTSFKNRLSKMSDNQVIAIYFRLSKKGVL